MLLDVVRLPMLLGWNNEDSTQDLLRAAPADAGGDGTNMSAGPPMECSLNVTVQELDVAHPRETFL